MTRMKILEDRVSALEAKLDRRTKFCIDKGEVPLWNHLHSYPINDILDVIWE